MYIWHWSRDILHNLVENRNVFNCVCLHVYVGLLMPGRLVKCMPMTVTSLYSAERVFPIQLMDTDPAGLLFPLLSWDGQPPSADKTIPCKAIHAGHEWNAKGFLHDVVHRNPRSQSFMGMVWPLTGISTGPTRYGKRPIPAVGAPHHDAWYCRIALWGVRRYPSDVYRALIRSANHYGCNHYTNATTKSEENAWNKHR